MDWFSSHPGEKAFSLPTSGPISASDSDRVYICSLVSYRLLACVKSETIYNILKKCQYISKDQWYVIGIYSVVFMCGYALELSV